MILARMFILVPLLLVAPVWADSYYRCEEPNGRIVFLQSPCNGNSKATKALQSSLIMDEVRKTGEEVLPLVRGQSSPNIDEARKTSGPGITQRVLQPLPNTNGARKEDRVGINASVPQSSSSADRRARAEQQADYEKLLLVCWRLFGYGHIRCSNRANIAQEVEARQQQQQRQQQEREESQRQKAEAELNQLREEQEWQRAHELATLQRARELAEQRRIDELVEQREYEEYQQRMMKEEEQKRLTQGAKGGREKEGFVTHGVRRK